MVLDRFDIVLLDDIIRYHAQMVVSVVQYGTIASLSNVFGIFIFVFFVVRLHNVLCNASYVCCTMFDCFDRACYSIFDGIRAGWDTN